MTLRRNIGAQACREICQRWLCQTRRTPVDDIADKVKSYSPNDRFVIALHSPDANFQTGLPVGPPEKRATELAFGVQQDTFSESDLGARHAELRGFVAILRGKTAEFLCG